MARQPNGRLWYSCDRDTGVPGAVPEQVRVAYLRTDERDQPAGDLVFRIRRLRRRPFKRINLVLVCPVENGATGHGTVCERCGVCWK